MLSSRTYSRRQKAGGRRQEENAIVDMVWRIENVKTVVAVAINKRNHVVANGTIVK